MLNLPYDHKQVIFHKIDIKLWELISKIFKHFVNRFFLTGFLHHLFYDFFVFFYFWLQTVQLLKAVSAVLHLLLWQQAFLFKAPVAGISCGLITTEDGFTTMVDIQGLEDFYGEMDFKVAGTKKGITSIQVDIKNDGLPYEVIEEALAKTRKARLYIIDEVMNKAIDAPKSRGWRIRSEDHSDADRSTEDR